MNIRQGLLATLIVACASLAAATAAEIPDGTVISAANIDQYSKDTFEGHTLKDLLTERMEWMIRKEGFKPKLIKSSEVKLDPAWFEATKKYSGQVKFDPKTRIASGYVAGVPFPGVKPSDPEFAIKQIWNYYYGAPHGDYQNYPRFAYVMIDGGHGLASNMEWTFQRYFLKGLLHGEGGSHTRGKGKDLSEALLFARSPRDIRGLGTFTVFHDDGTFPSVWAYVPAVRRIRQLTGGAWDSPIGGTDQLNSDLEISNWYPTWFPKYTYIGERWILASVHANWAWDPKKGNSVDAYPGIDLKNKPNFEPVNVFEPRKVWVIDATPPVSHPYGRIRLYMEEAYPRFNMAEVYDKKGNFWKEEIYTTRSVSGPDGAIGVASTSGFTMDFQQMHTTVFMLDPKVQINTPGVRPEDLSISVLQQASQ